jgi:hypothetical protein
MELLFDDVHGCVVGAMGVSQEKHNDAVMVPGSYLILAMSEIGIVERITFDFVGAANCHWQYKATPDASDDWLPLLRPHVLTTGAVTYDDLNIEVALLVLVVSSTRDEHGSDVVQLSNLRVIGRSILSLDAARESTRALDSAQWPLVSLPDHRRPRLAADPLLLHHEHHQHAAHVAASGASAHAAEAGAYGSVGSASGRHSLDDGTAAAAGGRRRSRAPASQPLLHHRQAAPVAPGATPRSVQDDPPPPSSPRTGDVTHSLHIDADYERGGGAHADARRSALDRSHVGAASAEASPNGAVAPVRFAGGHVHGLRDPLPGSTSKPRRARRAVSSRTQHLLARQAARERALVREAQMRRPEPYADGSSGAEDVALVQHSLATVATQRIQAVRTCGDALALQGGHASSSAGAHSAVGVLVRRWHALTGDAGAALRGTRQAVRVRAGLRCGGARSRAARAGDRRAERTRRVRAAPPGRDERAAASGRREPHAAPRRRGRRGGDAAPRMTHWYCTIHAR